MKTRLRRFIHARALYVTVSALILVAGLLLTRLQHAPQQVGTSLVAAGVVSFLVLWETWAREEDSERQSNLRSSGLRLVHRRRNLDEYHAKVGGLENRLDVTGYSLRSFLDSHGGVIKDKSLQKRPPRVRLLLVDPSCEASKSQEEIEEFDPGTFAGSVQRVIKLLAPLEGIEVRLLPFALSTMIFRVDDIMWTGPYFGSGSSAATLTLEIEQGGWMFGEYEKEFDGMWSRATAVDPPAHPQP
jgi:hypothetical protein